AKSRDPLVRNFLIIREAFLNLLGMSQYAMASRHFFAAHLAARLDRIRRSRMGGGQDARVRAVLDESSSVERLAALDHKCRDAVVSGGLSFLLVQRILIAFARRRDTRFGPLVEAVHSPYLDRGAGTAAYTLRGGELWDAYCLRRRRWEGLFPDRIAQFVANYAANYWMRGPFTASTDLLTHVLHLLARVAVIRFLLFNHPALEDLGGQESSRSFAESALDRAVVEVVYTFSREVDHSDQLADLLDKVLAQCRVRGLHQVPDLARF
ncbi:MAG: hypothetical protein ACREMO_07990, partial [Gemmatimonadales bacterium]